MDGLIWITSFLRYHTFLNSQVRLRWPSFDDVFSKCFLVFLNLREKLMKSEYLWGRGKMTRLQSFNCEFGKLGFRPLYLILLFRIKEQYWNMMIDEAIAETIPTHIAKEKPLEETYFALKLDSQYYDRVCCTLYPKYILVDFKNKAKKEFLKINFNFDLILELLRENDESQKLGRPIGLKFQRFEKNFILTSESEQTLLCWRDHLATRLNLRGFHELFKPIKKIGKGNFATVYLVTKHENGKQSAVKAFSKEGTYSQEFGKESLINQIQIMRKFNHRSLMKLNQVYQSQNSIYVSVELLEGGQLYDKIKTKHKFTPKEIKMVMKGILEGLQVMHQQDIMHRDLKPENILLRTEGDFDCVIADFGLAQNVNEDYMFVRCGTPGYVAPEVVNLKDLKAKYSSICDLFSVGVIFHMLALKKSPFPGKEYDQVLSQNRHCNINYELTMYQTLPQSWLDLLKRLLEKDPAKRITATEALNHDFFSKDELFKEFVQNRRNTFISSQECNSPLMMSKNKERKNKGLVRDDSCLKFKMKQNLMTGRIDESGQMIEQIDSPAAIKHRVVKINESRFKKYQH